MRPFFLLALAVGWFGAICGTSSAAEAVLWQQFKQAKLAGTEPTLPDFSYAGYDYSESELPDTSGWTVFDVTDYGAVADDGNYDDASIQATIDAAEAAGGGIVFFPSGRFMVSPNNDITETIKVQGSNILLKGSGSGAGGTEIFMDEMKVNNGRYMFEVLPTSTSETTLTTVVADAPRESFVIQVADASALSVGQRIVLKAGSVPYATAYYAPLALDPAWERLTSTQGFNINEIHTVAAIDGNTVTFREPLHLPMITTGITIQVRSYNVITDVGVEDILFKGNWNSYPENFVHHKNDIHDYSWNALRFDNVANGWLRNCEFKDWTQGVYFDGCASFTVDGISFTGKMGHMSIHTRRSYGVLVKDCVDTAGHYHGPGVGYSGCGTVYLRHQMAGNQTIDSHSGSPYATLMDQVTGGNFDGNGGPYASYPHHGKHFVAWNFNVSGGPNSYNFWPSSRNGHTFATPLFVGLQGKSISMSGEGENESPGTAVEPASLFEAQLKFRLGPTTETALASGIGTDSATLTGSLVSTGEAPSTVRIYWGTSDGGTDVNAWESVEDLGSSSVGPLSVSVSGLDAGQTYHYRVWASNVHYDAWAAESASFTIPGPPSVIATGATNAAGTQATLNGSLGGGNPADVTVVWDIADRGTNAVEDWPAANAIVLSNQAEGNFAVTATSLVPGQDYTYRIFVSNAEGDAWTNSGTFSVLPVNYTLLEDFESRTLGAAINGQGDWGGDTTSANEFSVQIDPDDSGNQVLYFNEGVDKEVYLNPAALRIEDNQTSTVFFRIRAVPAESGAADLWLRMTLSDVLNPSDFNDGETDLGISDNGSASLLLSGIADPLAEARWYRVWFVVDNASDSFDTYLQAEGDDQVVGLTNQTFRNGTAANDLLSIMFKVSNNSGNGSNGDVWIDDIYIAQGVDGHSFSPIGSDKDMDKLPDQWEQDYFGSISVSAGGEGDDWDSDRYSDYDEWLAGTNPSDASSFFWLSLNPTTGMPDEITITWPSLTDRTYTIEARGNLVEGTWTPVLTDITGESATTSRTFSMEDSSMFYRVRIEP